MNKNHFEIEYTLPLSQPTISPGLIVLSEISQESVSVTFAGRGFDLLRDQLLRHPESIHLNVEISDQSQTFPLSITEEFTNSSIEFREESYSALEATAFNPRNIELIIDRNTVRHLPVSITSTEGIPERYYWMETSNVMVEIKGAESIVGNLDSCYTEPVIPGIRDEHSAIVKPDGVVYIIPSSVSAELVPPVRVVDKIE